MQRKPWYRSMWTNVLVLALASAMAEYGFSASAGAIQASSPHGTVTVADSSRGAPTYIMPFVASEYNSVTDIEMQSQLWPRLYTIGTANSSAQLNSSLSLASAPVYSDGDTVVTVKLKSYKWSDGSALSARDITFFMNLLKANKTEWANYVPGNMPDNIASWSTKGTSTVVFRLTHAVNPSWFTDDQLAYIVPLPQQSWDKTSETSPDGNYDQTTAGAEAVYRFLNKQGQTRATYDTNPLWRVVDGPWQLETFSADGYVTLRANTAYSGPDKPHIAQLEMVPFTSTSAEFDAVLSGSIDVGYVPDADLTSESRVESSGYKIVRSALAATNMLSLNYNSPIVGPLVRQLYIRRVLNDLMNQPEQIKALLSGSGGYPDWGPIPPEPATPYISASQKRNPFSISVARHLLLTHGWTIPKSGAAVCAHPGTSSSECGAGIAKGKKLTFSLLYISGTTYMTGEMASYKSDASEVGVQINLKLETFTAIVGTICGTADCDSPGWEITNWGAGFAWEYGSPYPVGATLFEGHVGLDDPITAKLRSLIDATETAPASDTIKAMRAYDDYVVKEEPEVWQLETYTVTAVAKKFHDVSFSTSGNIFPQNWYIS